MAVTLRMQIVKPAIVAAACITLILLGAPPWGAGPAAGAATGNNQAKRFLIAWEEGRADLERVVSLAAENSHIRDLLGEMAGMMETLEGGEWPAPDIQAVSLPAGTPVSRAQELLSSLPGVRYVEEDAEVSVDVSPQDPYYSKQWFLPHIGADKAWEAEKGSGDVVVAVLDTGVDRSHPDLAGRVLAGYDFVGNDSNTADNHGHGTHVAGIIAASGEDGAGVAGVAWRVKVLPVKVLDDSGGGKYSDVIAGVRYAADNGAAVVNLSLGGGTRSQALQEAVDYARSRGAIVVAAAGNDALTSLSYPAACDGVIGVGAADEEDRPASFSNRGEGLDLVAPGVSIYSDSPGGGYEYMSGTSMAAPQVSGAFALLFSHEPGLAVAAAEKRMLSAALDLGPEGYDLDHGWGLLRVDKALGLEDTEPDGRGYAGGDWYFAEGYTGPGFDTYLLLENPGLQASPARLDLSGTQGPSASLNLEVAPQARLTLRLNDLVPPGDVAARISLPEGSEVVAQRSMYFDYHGIKGGHTSRGCPASSEWYFAEGYTGPGFDTYLLVFNPQGEAAKASLSLMTTSGVVNHNLEIPPLARRTLKLNDIMPGTELAVALSADLPVVAERAMYFDSGGRRGGSDAAGAPALSREWYFAEGYTGGDFDEWLLLANPSDREVAATATFQRSDGITVESELVLRPFSRATLHVDEIAGLEDAEVSAAVKASAPGLVAERAMYFDYEGCMGTVDGGHAAGGATAPSSHWLIPEGYTGPGFESWLLVSNLEDEGVTVGVDIYGESGTHVRGDLRVEAHSRLTVKENDLLPGEGVSAEVSAPDGTRLVVEGAFYFRYQGEIDDGST
jgi:subtilisin family serine protease